PFPPRRPSDLQPTVLEREAAATSVITGLDDLVLQGLLGEIVPDAAGKIEPLAVFAPIADQRANLIRQRLLERAWFVRWDANLRRRQRGNIAGRGILIQTEVGDGRKKFAVRLRFDQRPDGGQPLNLGIVLKDLLEVIRTARSEFEIADDGRPVPRAKSKGKGRDGIERSEERRVGKECRSGWSPYH